MGIKNILGVSLLTLILVSSVEAQQGRYPVQTPGLAPVPYPSTSPVAPYGPSVPGYSPAAQPPAPAPFQAVPGPSAGQQSQWPHYPYPQYHNPYYREMSPRDAISGTIDWVFALPSHLMDRFSSFLDGNVFPQVPATQGAQGQPRPQVVPNTNPPPPPATPYSTGRP